MAKVRAKRTKSTRDRKLQKAKRSASQRAHARPIDLGAGLVLWSDVGDLAEVLPLPLEDTHFGSGEEQMCMLPHSPAATWYGIVSEGQDTEDTREMIERWPFRIVRAGVRVDQEDGWACLRMLAHRLGQSVADTVLYLDLLEEHALLYWHPETSTYVVPEDASVVGPQADQVQTVRVLGGLLDQRASEPAATRASRTWAQVNVDHTYV